MAQVPTLFEINKVNREYWDQVGQKMKIWMRDELLVRHAMEDVNDERQRGVPVYYQNNLECLLDKADRRRAEILALHGTSSLDDPSVGRGSKSVAEVGRQGGKATRADPLGDLIMDLARDPTLTWKQLGSKLKTLAGQSVIVSVEDDWITYDRGRGRIARARYDGLKDRLSRARKKLRTQPGS